MEQYQGLWVHRVAIVLQHRLELHHTGVFSSGISKELQTLIGIPPPHQPLHPLEAYDLWIIGFAETSLKA
jgi:hypothetical protein